jgi:hypothetical protein
MPKRAKKARKKKYVAPGIRLFSRACASGPVGCVSGAGAPGYCASGAGVT